MQQIGKYVIIAGIFLLVVGVILYFAGNKLGWLGNLPGDIKIKRENFTFYAPITTMILISIFLSILFWIISKIK
jgi:hypothetical protein